MGDRKNYSKVVFNNGLKSQSGGQETGVIDYEAGYIYSKNGSATKHYEKKPTKTYTGRTITVTETVNEQEVQNTYPEYIYIKNTAGWQDLHITFYDANDGQILQKGHGYVMDYAGNDGKDYYRIPIPEDAAKFSINNGTGQANQYATDKYSIVRLGSNGKSTSEETASDRFVYNLEGTTSATLTRINLNEGTPTEVESETVIAQVEDTSNYTPNTPNSGVRQTVSGTDDTLNIRDSAATKWNLPIGAATVTFYDEDGAVVGSGVMMKTNADSDGYVWYTKKIPINAASFSVSYVNSSTVTNTPTYPLYSKTADSDGNKTTKGDMFYETAGTNKLSMIYAKPALDEIDDETYQKRGDDLYLVCDSKFDRNPTVTFYANGDNILRSGVTGKYINVDENGKHWYRVSIPKGVESFKINDTGDKYPIYELKSKFSRYQKDYTLGDMQYSYKDSTATLLYPIFTLDDEYTLSVSDDKTISSKSGLLTVDTSVTEPYADADSGITPATDVNIGSTLPVLYDTASNDITYTWTEGTGTATGLWYDNTTTQWSSVYACFYNSSENAIGGNWPGTEMSPEENNKYSVSVPNDSSISYVIIHDNNENKTTKISLSSENSYGEGKIIISESYSSGTKVYFDNSQIGWSNVYAYFWGGSVSSTYPGTIMTNEGNGLYSIEVPSGATNVIFNEGKNKAKTLDLTLDSTKKIFHPRTSSKIMILNGAFNTDSSQPALQASIDGGNYTGGSDFAQNYGGFGRGRSYTISGTPSKIQVKYNLDSQDHDSQVLTLNSDNNYGKGLVYWVNADGSFTLKGIGDESHSDSGYWTNIAWSLENNTSSSSSTYTVTYQPEDRYGMISTQNTSTAGVRGFEDSNDFITLVIPDSITTPYIKFYTSTDGSSGYINNAASNASTKGLLLADDTLELNGTTYTTLRSTDTTNHTKTYMVRLPKNARSFTITNGTRSGTHT